MRANCPKLGEIPVLTKRTKTMKTTKNHLSATWLNGKYPEIQAEINTSIGYVAIGEFFAQGDEAEAVIAEINEIYNTQDVTVPEAIQIWSNIYL
jgi:hypothetical protein